MKDPKTISGHRLHPLALGCWGFAGGNQWGPQEDKISIKTIHFGHKSGINILDTAPGYGNGHSEEIIGKAIQSFRDEVFIATKVSPQELTKEKIIESCKASLKRLQTDVIDLYQPHWANKNVPCHELMEGFQTLHEEGLIRYIGVCNFGVESMKELLNAGLPILSNQVPYSIAWRAIEFDIVPFCREQQIGILAYSPLLHGLLTGKYQSADSFPEGRRRTRHFSKNQPQTRHGELGYEELTFKTLAELKAKSDEWGLALKDLAICWAKAEKSVLAVIAGSRTPDQLQSNIEGIETTLSMTQRMEINRISEALKHALGSNPDLWEKEGRYW